MIGRQRGEALEPEVGQLREHLAFAWDAVGHDAIEGRDPVGGHQQQGLAQIKNLADLAALYLANAGQIKLEQWFGRHRRMMKLGVQSSKFKDRLISVFILEASSDQG